MICTKNKLEQEIDFIKTILLGNGYPEDTVLKHISKKIAQFSTAKPLRPENCPVYLRAPWIGSASQQLEHQVKSAVQNCYGAVSPRLIFSSQCMLPAAKKDVLPANQRSMVIYEYVCQCDCQFVDHTTQRLQQRIKQHVPKAIKQKTNLTQEQRTHRSQPTRTQPNRKCKEKSKTQLEPESDSAIGQHLLQSNQCAHHYSDSHFKILTTARSQFHLNLLEAVYISRKKTDLCRQKQFIFTLQACCHWIDCVSPYYCAISLKCISPTVECISPYWIWSWKDPAHHIPNQTEIATEEFCPKSLLRKQNEIYFIESHNSNFYVEFFINSNTNANSYCKTSPKRNHNF